MADKARTVNTKFWTDSYIEGLSPSEKLLFLYCLTSPQSNLLGIYEVSESRIRFETGLPVETIRKGFKRFTNDNKVFYKHNFIIIPKFLEHQRLNANMKIGVTKLIQDLPKWLQTELFGNALEGLGNDSKAFETIRNTLLKKEIEIETEIEMESESETEDSLSFEDFFNRYHEITKKNKTDKEAAFKKWRQLTKTEQAKAVEMIETYSKTSKDSQYLKKARTYLNDKTFNDEMKPEKERLNYIQEWVEK